ncbi:hypothetical protein GCM10027040_08480 [Halomonas shantousis]
MEDFFNWLGDKLGDAIRVIVEALSSLFAGILIAAHDFILGLTGSLGMESSLFGIAVLIIGLLLLYNGIRALLRRSIVGGLMLIFLALVVLGWLIS